MFIKIFKTFLCFFYVSALYSETTLIKNATIYDGVKNIPFEGNILIENETIKRVSSTNMQADFVIDASGMIVTPGIIGTDTNIGIVEIGALSVTRDDSSAIYSIGFSIHDAFNPKSTLIPWNRSNGVTSALSLPQGTSSPIGGLGSYFLLDLWISSSEKTRFSKRSPKRSSTFLTLSIFTRSVPIPKITLEPSKI